MDYSEAELLVETVDEIWTLWGDIFEIEFQPSTMPKFRIWIRDQLRNVGRLKAKSRKLPNITKFDEIKTEFIKKINEIYQQNSIEPTTFMIHNDKEPTTDMIRNYNIDMVAISERLEALYNIYKPSKQPQHMRLQTQTAGLKSHEKADDQIESAIHRLISICEKLADQKKLAR